MDPRTNAHLALIGYRFLNDLQNLMANVRWTLVVDRLIRRVAFPVENPLVCLGYLAGLWEGDDALRLDPETGVPSWEPSTEMLAEFILGARHLLYRKPEKTMSGPSFKLDPTAAESDHPDLLMWGHAKFEIRDLAFSFGESQKVTDDIPVAWSFRGPDDSLWLLYCYMHTPAPEEAYDWHIRTTCLPRLAEFQAWLQQQVDETVANTRYLRIRKASL